MYFTSKYPDGATHNPFHQTYLLVIYINCDVGPAIIFLVKCLLVLGPVCCVLPPMQFSWQSQSLPLVWLIASKSGNEVDSVVIVMWCYRLRTAGVRGLQGVVRKTVSDDLQVNIWEKTHMDKIVPSLLYNMQVGMSVVTCIFTSCLFFTTCYNLCYW